MKTHTCTKLLWLNRCAKVGFENQQMVWPFVQIDLWIYLCTFMHQAKVRSISFWPWLSTWDLLNKWLLLSLYVLNNKLFLDLPAPATLIHAKSNYSLVQGSCCVASDKGPQSMANYCVLELAMQGCIWILKTQSCQLEKNCSNCFNYVLFIACLINTFELGIHYVTYIDKSATVGVSRVGYL